MKKKIIILSLISSLAILCLSGCSSEVKQTNKELTVYIGFKEADMKSAVAVYKQKYPEVNVNVIESKLGDKWDEEAALNEESSFLSELMSGKGVDVFQMQWYWDMDKVKESGMLADLSEFYEKDTTFDKENYNQAVMDSALYEGKRLYIPLSYSIPLLLSTESILKKEDFHVENCKDFVSFRKETEKWREHKSLGRKLFRLGKTTTFNLSATGYGLVDFHTKRINLDSEEIKDYFRWCKAALAEDEKDGSNYIYGGLEGAAALRDGKIIFENSLQAYGYGDIVRNCRAINTFDKSVMLPIRNLEGGVTAMIESAVGVRGNSVNKQNAYNFIKVLLSDDVQRTPGAQVKGAIPVSYKVMEDIVYPPTSNTTFGEEINGFPKDCPVFAKEQQEEFMRYTKEVNKACFLPKWRNKLMEAMQPYFNGEMSYEECIKQAKEQVELYLSE
ncbi:ABC transporter substrate-binding protein [Anaerocolumna xylanovorans]|uniref:ABC-type glycerol-3-phosphate transport system, substrate-binding protein n=1 Tax=Anaerocolumna xylanovorans DSM 12503 TaxID=1121345 RepID=A0A1M7YDX5_9FIRM|nr:ABC transporter substrate-binding protein [Anaerocolumna xylanovorans]SHO50850.1 ABC-type glycerol-3-phosphate transport system, substrate-binding protein [Anaerocolumna xylanovorans DSM 12503]